jgi:polysaccharide export outer membrane protein
MVNSKLLLIFWLWLIALGLGGCGGERATLQAPAPGQVDTKYRLGAGDKINVTVFGNPNLSGPVTVESDGALTLPLLGTVKAAGRHLDDVQAEIRTRLDKDFVVNPRVQVEVMNYRPFFILGEVGRPGSYPYVPDLTARQAVALGGGFTRRAQTDTVSVTRSTQAGKANLQLDIDDPILPGDTVEVGRRWF